MITAAIWLAWFSLMDSQLLRPQILSWTKLVDIIMMTLAAILATIAVNR